MPKMHHPVPRVSFGGGGGGGGWVGGGGGCGGGVGVGWWGGEGLLVELRNDDGGEILQTYGLRVVVWVYYTDKQTAWFFGCFRDSPLKQSHSPSRVATSATFSPVETSR